MFAYLLNDKKRYMVGNRHFSLKMSQRKKLQLKCGNEMTKKACQEISNQGKRKSCFRFCYQQLQ